MGVEEGFEVVPGGWSMDWILIHGWEMYLLISISPLLIPWASLLYRLSSPGIHIPKVSVNAEESSDPYSHFAFLRSRFSSFRCYKSILELTDTAD